MQNRKSSRDVKEIQSKPTLRRERKWKDVLHCYIKMQLIVTKGEEEYNLELPDNVSISLGFQSTDPNSPSIWYWYWYWYFLFVCSRRMSSWWRQSCTLSLGCVLDTRNWPFWWVDFQSEIDAKFWNIRGPSWPTTLKCSQALASRKAPTSACVTQPRFFVHYPFPPPCWSSLSCCC